MRDTAKVPSAIIAHPSISRNETSVCCWAAEVMAGHTVSSTIHNLKNFKVPSPVLS